MLLIFLTDKKFCHIQKIFAQIFLQPVKLSRLITCQRKHFDYCDKDLIKNLF